MIHSLPDDEEGLAERARASGMTIEDRRAGINKALSLAKAGDIVLVTGKGAEQSMEIGGRSIPWDDRVVVKEELEKLR